MFKANRNEFDEFHDKNGFDEFAKMLLKSALLPFTEITSKMAGQEDLKKDCKKKKEKTKQKKQVWSTNRCVLSPFFRCLLASLGLVHPSVRPSIRWLVRHAFAKIAEKWTFRES